MRNSLWIIFCFGVLLGIGGRIGLDAPRGLMEYSWIAFILSAFCLGVLMGNIGTRRLKDEIQALNQRLQRAESRISAKVSQTGHKIDTPKDLDSQGYQQTHPMASAGLQETHHYDIDDLKKRRVRVTKLLGKSKVKSQFSIVGIEELPPEAGREYRVFTERGTTLCTSVVSKVAPCQYDGLAAYVQTKNSVYHIEVLEDEKVPRDHLARGNKAQTT